jgi:hypothetical protein
MDRARHRHNRRLRFAGSAHVSAVPQPSAVAEMMAAPHTCFCGARRSVGL